jgi:hypothetical protein
MPHSLSELEQRRQAIAQQIAQLGDLRPGSVTGTSGRCGKPECRCHQPSQPGHGPNFRLTYKLDGKTVSESLPTAAAIHKAEREVAEGRSGQYEDQPAHTRQAKLGCTFRQTRWDAEGYPIRDPDSTTYTGAIETAEEFGKRLYLEAWKRGWSRAQKKVVIGDGAEWISNLAQEYFPGAVQIVDLYHARQHLWVAVTMAHLEERVTERRRKGVSSLLEL